ncbi:hypothetical protein ACE2AJ_15040 [Aquihabitans daechungensis]|uniref:hypothetical protein n=1 Tax=Aquihabitans daechungensis TaxID=1052257 RepID=UPI003BA259FF
MGRSERAILGVFFGLIALPILAVIAWFAIRIWGDRQDFQMMRREIAELEVEGLRPTNLGSERSWCGSGRHGRTLLGVTRRYELVDGVEYSTAADRVERYFVAHGYEKLPAIEPYDTRSGTKGRAEYSITRHPNSADLETPSTGLTVSLYGCQQS